MLGSSLPEMILPKFQHFLNIFSVQLGQINFLSFALCQASKDTSLEYPQSVLWSFPSIYKKVLAFFSSGPFKILALPQPTADAAPKAEAKLLPCVCCFLENMRQMTKEILGFLLQDGSGPQIGI